MERLMSNPNTHPSCKILVEEVYNRYLDSDNLWEYFYTLVEIAELKVGDYNGHDCNLMLEIVSNEEYKISEIYCIH